MLRREYGHVEASCTKTNKNNPALNLHQIS